MTRYISHSLEQTAQIAHEWLRSLVTQVRPAGSATIVGLSGHLGAGKTAFTKCVAKDLGITEDVTSPTFVIMKIYTIDSTKVVMDRSASAKDSGVPRSDFPWKRLVHIDAYRLEQGRELEALDFEKYAADPENLILIEWPENVKEMVAALEGYKEIKFSVGDKDTERVVEY